MWPRAFARSVYSVLHQDCPPERRHWRQSQCLTSMWAIGPSLIWMVWDHYFYWDPGLTSAHSIQDSGSRQVWFPSTSHRPSELSEHSWMSTMIFPHFMFFPCQVGLSSANWLEGTTYALPANLPWSVCPFSDTFSLHWVVHFSPVSGTCYHHIITVLSHGVSWSGIFSLIFQRCQFFLLSNFS